MNIRKHATSSGALLGPTRRTFLQGTSGLLSAALLSGANAAATKPSIHFPNEARARLAVTSYPFRERIETPTNRARNPKLPGMDLKEFPAFVAEQFGVHNINPLLDHFGSTDPTYLEAFRAALDRANSHIVDLGLGGKRFYASDSSVRQAAVDYGRKCVDVAAHVGSPSVRQHVSGDAKRDVSLAADSLGQLAEYAAKRNVVINLENDSAIPEDPFFLVAIITKANNPYLRALPDFGNSMLGHDAEYNQRAVAAMLTHAFNMCHVKNTVVGEGLKLYHVDLARMFKLAKSSGYLGYFSMEYDTASGDPLDGTRELVKDSLHYLSNG